MLRKEKKQKQKRKGNWGTGSCMKYEFEQVVSLYRIMRREVKKFLLKLNVRCQNFHFEIIITVDYWEVCVSNFFFYRKLRCFIGNLMLFGFSVLRLFVKISEKNVCT